MSFADGLFLAISLLLMCYLALRAAARGAPARTLQGWLQIVASPR